MDKRRESTIVRHNMVHKAFRGLTEELGEIARYVSREELYRRLSDKLKHHPKTISKILNHTIYTN